MAPSRPLKLRTPKGERLVVLPEAKYRKLCAAAQNTADVRAYDKAMARLALGEDELVPAAVVERLLSQESPIKVWREFRGMSRKALAAAAAVGVPFLTRIEAGEKQPGLATRKALAKALRLSPEALIQFT